MISLLREQVSGWTTETPTTPGWYWVRHAVFRGTAGTWHELLPMVVELVRDGNSPMMLLVSWSE